MEIKCLLAYTVELASVKTRKQLSRFVEIRLKNILQFDHSTIFLLNRKGRSMNDFLFDPETAMEEGPFCQNLNVEPDAEKETRYDFDKISQCQDLQPYVRDRRTVYKGLLLNLESGNSVFGHWVLLYTAGKVPEREGSNRDFLYLLASQLSIVVSRIVADEMVLERETETEVLQSLSVDFVSVRDKKDLLKVIHIKLNKLFDFGHHWVAVINEDQLTMTPFLQEPASKAKNHPKYEQVIRAKYPINDRIFNKVLLSKQPQVFDLDQLSARPDMPEYMQILHESGIRKIVMIGLQVGDRIIGVWAICLIGNQQMSFEQLNLVTGISYQMSTAVYNILANEEIVRREKERELLLSLSSDFAAVRNTNELLLVINRRLKCLLGFSHGAIATLNKDQTTASAFILDPESISKTHPTYQEVINHKHPINDGIINKIVASVSPIVVDLDQLVKESELPIWLKVNFESGVRQLVAVRFSKGSRVFGFWLVYFENKILMDENKLSLMESLASQISIAVSNIIANEEVSKREEENERQLMEINRYKQQLEAEKIYLKEEIETSHHYSEILGDSPSMQTTFRLVSQVAASDSTVLILGETGTGKELIARAIHNGSPRKNKLMVKVNCAALPANLIESELFGHERGSFTGATDRRIGKFELANGGTLFLDEIGEMPLELQVKLLRALQEREIERIGGRSTIKVDVRIIAATNRELEKEMAEGKFRSDLYYRLNIFPISLPPLRDRREDIPLLTSHFMRRFAVKTGRDVKGLTNSAMQELMQYNWPGNIRELEHLIERSVLLETGDTIRHFHLPLPKQHLMPASGKEVFLPKTIAENEREFILKTITYCGGRISGEGGAAELLGVPPSTLNSKMKRLGIRRQHIC